MCYKHSDLFNEIIELYEGFFLVFCLSANGVVSREPVNEHLTVISNYLVQATIIFTKYELKTIFIFVLTLPNESSFYIKIIKEN